MRKKVLKTLFRNSGFTLMEMVVVLAVFSLTAIMAVDIFLSVTKVQRQTRNVQAVQSDARFALEEMVREAGMGTIDYEYYQGVCQGTEVQNPGDPCTNNNECPDGFCAAINLNNNTYILATRDQDNKQIFYRRTSEGSGDKIEVCSNTSEDFNRCDLITLTGLSQNNWQTVTPESVKVTKLQFYIIPASNPFSKKNSCTDDTDCDSGDCQDYLCTIPDDQPMVTIVLETEAGSGSSQEKINLQTTTTSLIYRR